MAMLANRPDFVKLGGSAGRAEVCAPMCGAVRNTERQDSMAVNFFGGQDGAGARVWSAGKFVANEQDEDKLRARIKELESLCTDVLVAGVDIGLPQNLLNQLWAAVGHGEVPHAYHVDLPPAPPRPIEGAAGEQGRQPQGRVDRREPMEIPDIPLDEQSDDGDAGQGRIASEAAAGGIEAAQRQEDRLRRRRRPDDARRAGPHPAARELRVC